MNPGDDTTQRRMLRRTYSRDRIVQHLIPIIIGIGGIVMSMQLRDLYVRIIVLMLSVSIPLFAGGNILARYRTGRVERVLLGSGLFMLIFGATLSVSGFGTDMVYDYRQWFVGENLTRVLGVLSLMLGLFAILYTVGRTSEDIEEVGERFRHLADHMSEGIVLSDAQGNVILVNERFVEMLGVEDVDLIGANTAQLASQFNLSPVIENLAKRKRGESSEYTVMFSVRGELRHFVVNGKPILDEHGKLTATLATFRDDTEQHMLRKRVERYAGSLEHLVQEQTQRLTESEARMRQLLLSMSEGFLTIGDDNRIRFVNERMAQILGQTRENLLNHDLEEFLDLPGRIRLLNLLARDPASDTEPSRQELTFLSRSGGAVPVMAAVSRMAEAAGDSATYSIVVSDISDLKSMESQLRERAAQLEQANEELRLHDRAKDSFLSNVSHELRTPLSTVNGYVEMLAAGTLGTLKEEQARVVGVMKRNLDRLADLINEIIEFSRMEIRGLDLRLTLFDLEDLVNESAASALPGAAEKDITINIEIPQPIGYAWGDRRRLVQVLGILLHNAVKFTGAGGMIVLRAMKESDGALTLTVQDNGIGIDPAHHEHVFSKFFQVDSSRSRRYEGAGIGLSIAKSIATSHGGDITLESAINKGSTFRMRLPEACFDAALPDTPRWGEGRSLVVLDEFGWTAAMIQGLTSAAVRRVDASYQLMRDLERSHADLVILDSVEGETLGQDADRVLRQHPVYGGIPRLVLHQAGAAFPDSLDLDESVLALQKPFTARALLAAIRLVLNDSPEPSPEVPQEPLPGHVLVIDADPELLGFLALALGTQNIPCCTAHDPEQALRMARQVPVRAILVDADIPDVVLEDYLEPLQDAEETKNAPIYFLTGVENGYHDLHGVSGILRKPFTAEQLAALLRNEEDPKRD